MINIIPYLISTIALVVSIAGYLLNRKMYNENKVFDEKIRSYTEINKALDKLVGTLVQNLFDGREVLKERKDGWRDILEEIADEIDVVIEHFNSSITVNCLLIPGEVIDDFDEFADFLDSQNNHDILESLDRYQEFVNMLYIKSEGLIVRMREDLNSDKLNKGLQKRIQGNWGHRFLGVE